MQLIISTGPAKVAVPGVVNKSQADAKAALAAAGFQVTVTQDYSTTVKAGIVIKQDPAPTTLLTKFQTVTIVVSKGPQTVVLPQIPSLTPLAQATATLQALGLLVTTQKAFGGSTGLVVGMSPDAGTTVNVGSTVILSYI